MMNRPGRAGFAKAARMDAIRHGDYMRHLLTVVLVAVGLMGLPSRAEAQSPSESDWSPTRNSLALGYHQYTGDGESAWRVGVGWYLSPQARTTAMARFWGGHDQVEVEGRWIRASERVLRPFATASVLGQRRSVRRSVGGTIGGGLELYLKSQLVLDIGLVWQSLFHDSGANDSHWFRVNAGVSFVPLPWPSSQQEQ